MPDPFFLRSKGHAHIFGNTLYAHYLTPRQRGEPDIGLGCYRNGIVDRLRLHSSLIAALE